MQIPVTEIVVASLLSFAMISSDSGSIAGVIKVASSPAKAGEQITGSWSSYSPTRYGHSSVEFFANGICQFSFGANTALPCKWREAENGQARIEAAGNGKNEVFSASIAGDYMVVKEPGRETSYVRTNSRAAFQRQKMAAGPSDHLIPRFFESDQK